MSPPKYLVRQSQYFMSPTQYLLPPMKYLVPPPRTFVPALDTFAWSFRDWLRPVHTLVPTLNNLPLPDRLCAFRVQIFAVTT